MRKKKSKKQLTKAEIQIKDKVKNKASYKENFIIQMNLKLKRVLEGEETVK